MLLRLHEKAGGSRPSKTMFQIFIVMGFYALFVLHNSLNLRPKLQYKSTSLFQLKFRIKLIGLLKDTYVKERIDHLEQTYFCLCY